MIIENKKSKLSPRVFFYILFRSIFLSSFLLFIAYLLFTLGYSNGGLYNSLAITFWSVPIFVSFVFALIALALPLRAVLWYLTFSFVVSDKAITINSGLIFKKNKEINFNVIYRISGVSGPLQMIFGLKQVSMMTASLQELMLAGRINFNDNQKHIKVKHKPDGVLILSHKETEELKSLVSDKCAGAWL
jgi:uncharacterized membrane protein YdbT with pleckstrin-like domain